MLHVLYTSWTEKFFLLVSSLCYETHFLHVMRRKPRLYDGTAMTNLDKKRLVEIFPRNGEPPDGGIGRDFGNNKLKPRTWKDETPSIPSLLV